MYFYKLARISNPQHIALGKANPRWHCEHTNGGGQRARNAPLAAAIRITRRSASTSSLSDSAAAVVS